MIEHSNPASAEHAADAPTTSTEEPPNAAAIQAWMVARLAEALQVDPGAIDVQLPLTSYGLESITVFTLTGDLADWLGQDMPATLLWEYPTVEAAAQYLAEQSGHC